MGEDRDVERAVPRARQQVGERPQKSASRAAAAFATPREVEHPSGVPRTSLRPRGVLAPLLLPALVLGVACGSGTSELSPSTAGAIDLDAGTAGPRGPSGLPCDVDAVLAQNCLKCHAEIPQFGAPMPLTTWDALHAAARSDGTKSVYELVPVRIANDDQPMPPPPNPRLSAADRKVVTDWVAAGAPRGPAACEGTTPPEQPTTSLACTPGLSLAPATPYVMPTDAGDQYVCFGVDVKATTPTHITALDPKIDNTKIVHHVVVYESPDAYSKTPTPCSPSAALTWRMVLGWAPGVKGLELPPEAGFPIAMSGEGTHYVVQMHYSNPQHLVGEKDASKIDLCTSPPRKYEADVLAFGTQQFTIPAAPPPGGVFTRDCTLKVTERYAGLHLFTAMPHMHQIGTAMSTTLKPGAGGALVDLGTQPSFDFNTQAYLPISATTAAGDVIRTRCSWSNTTGAEVRFGEKTADEMCYSFTMYYPRIRSELWSWAAPALPPAYGGATCTDVAGP